MVAGRAGRVHPHRTARDGNRHRSTSCPNADFIDGLSNTVGVSERLQGDWTKTRFRQGGDYRLGWVPISTSWTVDDALATCAGRISTEPQESRGGESWFLSGFHFSSYNHAATPNTRTNECAFDDARDAMTNRVMHNGVFAASSAHPGGVQTLFMDGSGRFVKDSVQLKVWRALATRSGGEAVAADAF